MEQQKSAWSHSSDRHARRTLAVAIVAMACDPNPAVNRDRIAENVRCIRRDHPEVRLVHFGETILGWYFKKGETAAYHRRIAEPIPGPSTAALGALAREQDVYLSFGMTEKAGNAVHNTQVLVTPAGEVLAVHRKLAKKDPVFAPGSKLLTTADVDGVRVAVLICSDVHDFRVFRAIRRARVDVVLAGLADKGTDLTIAQIVGCLFDAWSLTANRFGQEGASFWPGLITIADPVGHVRQHAVGKEHILFETLRIGSNRAHARIARRFVAATRLFGLSVVLIAQVAVRRLARPRRRGLPTPKTRSA